MMRGTIEIVNDRKVRVAAVRCHVVLCMVPGLVLTSVACVVRYLFAHVNRFMTSVVHNNALF